MSDKQVTDATVAGEALAELIRARTLFPVPLRSAHEGFAVLQEEVDELWTEVKVRTKSRERMRAEAIQVAAMAIKFVSDVCDS